MLGYKPRHFKMYTALTLENLVPLHHFYRKLEAKVDLSFVPERVRDRYAVMDVPTLIRSCFSNSNSSCFSKGSV